MDRIVRKIKRAAEKVRIEWLIFTATVLWGAMNALYIYSLDLTRILVDQNSHLNISRLVVDSLTPGISQLGFWPPLLHVLVAPFAGIDPLFQSGLAGAMVLVPLLGIAAVLMYKLILELTDAKILGIGAALLLVTNPYILYYSSTAMTESLFVFTLIGVAYFLVRFFNTMSFGSLVYLGVFVTLASTARYEGFLLIPIVTALIAFKLFIERKKYSEIEAHVILFGLIAAIGLGFTFIYGMAFGGGPLEFMNGDWAAAAQQESFYLPTVGDLGLSILYLVEASKLMIGEFMVLFSAVSLIALLLIVKDRNLVLPLLGASAVFLSPFFFDILALYKGSAILYLENLPPYDGYFNERYGLYWIGFAIVIPVVFIKFANDYFRGLSSLFRNSIGVLLIAFVVLANGMFLGSESFVNKYRILASAGDTTLPADQTAAGEFLSEEYDGGKILITRALQNYVPIAAGIPLKNYIHESNHEVYEQALTAPWFYARWVVMYNDTIDGIEEWRRAQERISRQWGNSEPFHVAYELVYENRSERVYKLRDTEVRKVVFAYNMNEKDIPSLNTDMYNWDHEAFFWELQDGIKFYQSGIRTAMQMDRKTGPLNLTQATY